MDVARGIVDVAGGSSPADRSPAEYYPLLLRAIASLEPDHKRRARRDIYDRARDLLFSKMSSAFPPLSGDDIRQARSVLEHAIEQVEAMVLAPEWAARRLQYRDPPSPPAAANEGLTEAEPDVRVEPGPPVFVDLPPARRSRRRRGIAVAAAMSMAVGAGAILVGLLVHVRATSKPDVAATTPVSSPVAPKPAMAERESQPATGQPATVDPAPVAPERWAQEVRPSDRPSGEPGGQIGRQLSIAELTAAIRADTKSAKAYLDRGAAFVAQGDIDRAIADFNEAVQRDPYGARARAGLYGRKGLFDREVADLNKAIEIRLADRQTAAARARETGAGAAALIASAYQRRAETCLRGGRTEQAIADFRSALAADPSLLEPRKALAQLGVAP